MMEFFSEIFGEIYQNFSVGSIPFVLGLMILYVAKKVRDALTPFDDNEELFEKDNLALGIATAGYYLGIIAAITGVLVGPSRGLWLGVQDIAIYGALAIVFLNIARFLTDTFLLYKFKINEELIRDKNDGTAWVMFGVYFATGMIVRGAITGESATLLSGLWSATYYFFLAQVVLIVSALVYQWLTSYDIHAEIENDNVAAGLALGGFIAALGVMVGSAISGNMLVNLYDTISFFAWALTGLLVLALTRFIVAEHILIPGYKISDEIAKDRNAAAGWQLVAAYQAMAWIFVLAV